ncbi:MAG: hypothetical protein OXH32_05495 [Acidobacteria bacterium]|nr:hypothetical protein [Acidobacteriota bacterium]
MTLIDANVLLYASHLAALALEHGASIATTDRDFTRFPGIDLMDPTEATSHQA